MDFKEVKDSGKRQEFTTGSVRDTQDGKPRYDLIPEDALCRLAMHYTHGATKYGDNNWQKGQPLSRYFSSLLRHVHSAHQGKVDEDHLAAVAWNAFAIIWTKGQIDSGNLPKELDDIYPDARMPLVEK